MEPMRGPYQHRPPHLSVPLIRDVVVAFYAEIRRDPALGPVFDGIIGDNWDAHLEKVCAFWRHVTRIDRSYPAREFMPAHLRHPQIQPSLLPRWLSLFRQTARDRCSADAADHLVDIAERMAASIEISLGRRAAPNG